MQLADAFKKAGLVASDEADKVISLKEQQEQSRVGEAIGKLQAKCPKTPSLEILKRTGSIAEFKARAEEVLREFPEVIGDVISEAHRFKNNPGGERLVRICYQVRDELKKPDVDKKLMLRKAFRRAGGGKF